jgi:hypothetical protein
MTAQFPAADFVVGPCPMKYQTTEYFEDRTVSL